MLRELGHLAIFVVVGLVLGIFARQPAIGMFMGAVIYAFSE